MTANASTLAMCAVLVAAALAVFFAGAWTARKPYKLCDSLFTPAERNFYYALTKAVDDNQVVFGKVRVADLITVKRKGDRKRDFGDLAKIAQKHVDFCICNKSDLSVLCVLELNDRSHEKRERIERDDFLKRVFADVKLPIVWVPAKSTYDIQSIKGSIIRAIEGTPRGSK
jgi:hypothetical protein